MFTITTALDFKTFEIEAFYKNVQEYTEDEFR